MGLFCYKLNLMYNQHMTKQDNILTKEEFEKFKASLISVKDALDKTIELLKQLPEDK